MEDYENYGGDYEYNIDNLIDYLDYLNLLKTVEQKTQNWTPAVRHKRGAEGDGAERRRCQV